MKGTMNRISLPATLNMYISAFLPFGEPKLLKMFEFLKFIYMYTFLFIVKHRLGACCLNSGPFQREVLAPLTHE